MSLNLTKIAPFLFVWLWSTGFIGAKYGLPYIEPFFMLFIRFCFVILIFLILINIYKAKWLNKTKSFQQVFIGTLIHGGYLGGVFFAIKLGVPAGITAIIVGMQPILTSIIGYLFLNQSLNGKQSIGLLLGFVGVSLVILENASVDTQNMNNLGLIACFIALLCISLGTVLQKQLASNISLLTGSFYQYIGAIIIVALITFSMEKQTVVYASELFIAMAWLIIGLSVFAVLLLLYMIKEGEVSKVSSYFYLVPPAAVIQSWILFDERLGILAIIGSVLTVIGVVFVVKSKTKR